MVIPIFVQFQDNQPIKTMDECDLFVLYEEDDAEDDDDNMFTNE